MHAFDLRHLFCTDPKTQEKRSQNLKVHNFMTEHPRFLQWQVKMHSPPNFGSDARCACLRSVEVYKESRSNLKYLSGAHEASVIKE